MSAATLFGVALLVIGIFLFVVYTKMGRLLRCILFTAATGLSSMGAVWLLGKLFSIGLALTPFSLITSVVLGLPGVLAMLFFQLL